MSRPDRESVISVPVGPKPQPSDQKLKQLESARKLAVESRKLKQRARLEAKLAQLRCLGDVSNEHLEKVCLLLVETEKDGRKRTNMHIEDINTNMEDMNEEIRAIRTMLQRVINAGRSTTPTPRPNDTYTQSRQDHASHRRPESSSSTSSRGVVLMN